MPNAKQRMTELIHAQPEDATYDELLRELAFARMVDRGLEDVRQGRVISDEEIKRRMDEWRK